MARQVSEERATAAVPGVSSAPAAQTHAGPIQGPIAASAVAGAVAGGAGLGALALAAFGSPVSLEAALANLLHAMVGIKALILAGAIALVLLRLRGPVGPVALLGYCGGLGASAAAVVWLWGLTGLLPGSALFYGGLITAYVSAARDALLADGLKKVVPRRC
jgi:hypothetical protein